MGGRDAVNSTHVWTRIVEACLSRDGDEDGVPLAFTVLIYEVARTWIRSEVVVRATIFLKNMQELHDTNLIPEGPTVYATNPF